MRSIHFTHYAQKQYKKLDPSIQQLIKKKMLTYAAMNDPLAHAKKLVSFEYGEYRFRIGDRRVICDRDIEGKIIIIALVGHRKNIYQ